MRILKTAVSQRYCGRNLANSASVPPPRLLPSPRRNPRPDLREPALPRLGPQSRRRRRHSMEHRLSRPGRRRTALARRNHAGRASRPRRAAARAIRRPLTVVATGSRILRRRLMDTGRFAALRPNSVKSLRLTCQRHRRRTETRVYMRPVIAHFLLDNRTGTNKARFAPQHVDDLWQLVGSNILERRQNCGHAQQGPIPPEISTIVALLVERLKRFLK